MKGVRELSDIELPEMSAESFRFYYLMYHLQDMAGLTYREARTVLMNVSNDSAESLAEEFECSRNAIYKFYQKGLSKIALASNAKLSNNKTTNPTDTV